MTLTHDAHTCCHISPAAPTLIPSHPPLPWHVWQAVVTIQSGARGRIQRKQSAVEQSAARTIQAAIRDKHASADAPMPTEWRSCSCSSSEAGDDGDWLAQAQALGPFDGALPYGVEAESDLESRPPRRAQPMRPVAPSITLPPRVKPKVYTALPTPPPRPLPPPRAPPPPAEPPPPPRIFQVNALTRL